VIDSNTVGNMGSIAAAQLHFDSSRQSTAF